jgi:hypothetical protein
VNTGPVGFVTEPGDLIQLVGLAGARSLAEQVGVDEEIEVTDLDDFDELAFAIQLTRTAELAISDRPAAIYVMRHCIGYGMIRLQTNT